MSMVVRYHPALVALHWLLAVTLLAALAAGVFVLAGMPNTDPAKIAVLRIHMSVGMAALLLMLIRLVVRWRTAKPPGATIGYPALDRLAPIVHYGFYLLVVAMVASGYATAILAGLNRSVFQDTGEPLPADFAAYPSFVVHGWLAAILTAFIAAHVAAATYHQSVRKDGLLRRMWFGSRRGTEQAQ
jgi:cytochrome b561